MKTLREIKFMGMADSWIDSQSCEQGSEGYVPRDRGTFKWGYLNGFDSGFKAAIEMLRSEEANSLYWAKKYEYPKQWADWLEKMEKAE